MYDESIEMYSDSEESPPPRPVSAFMANRSDLQTPRKKLSSQDFLPNQQPSLNFNYLHNKRMDPQSQQQQPPPTQGQDDGGRSNNKVMRPPSASASQQIQPKRSMEDEEDDDDEYEDELNSMAQIEGLFRRGKLEVDPRYMHLLDDEDVDVDFLPKTMFDMGENDSSEYSLSNDIGSIVENTLNGIPSPYTTFPEPPLHDDQAMMDYVRLKELWELQLDIKRDRISETLRDNCLKAGVHGLQAMYNPEDYANLNVTPEIKEIFGYITKHVVPPLSAGNDVKLHPFIPDYYPSVGDIDAFLKVIEPGVTEDGIGIKVLDEPAPFQSDPSVLDLRLRAVAKQSSAKAVVVKKVDNVGKNSKVIENWIKDISDLHRSKPSPSVHYSKPMPDIELLIQEWPPEIEEALKTLQLPPPDLNCDLATYADLVCSILDIPVYKSRVQSLHVLFTLFLTQRQFSNNFSDGLGGGQVEMMPSNLGLRNMMEDDDQVDHLQIS